MPNSCAESDDGESIMAVNLTKFVTSRKMHGKLSNIEGEDDRSQEIPRMYTAKKRQTVKSTDTVCHDNEVEDDTSHSLHQLRISVVSDNSQGYDTVSGVKTSSSDRPARPCPFCGKFKVRLTRHIKSVHKQEASVEHGLKGGLHEQREMFKMLKHSGIVKHNIQIASRKGAVLLTERNFKNSGSTVVYDSCSGVFKRRWFGTHRRQCGTERCVQPRATNSTIYFSSCPYSQ